MALEATKLGPGDLRPATRQYLFDLVVLGQASNAPRETMEGSPDGSKRGTTHKFAGERGLAPGKATYQRPGNTLGSPGKYRIIRLMKSPQDMMWIFAEHVGGSANAYKYYEILLPDCEDCQGWGKMECPECADKPVPRREPATRIDPQHHVVILRDNRKCERCKGKRQVRCHTCSPVGAPEPKKQKGPLGQYNISNNLQYWEKYCVHNGKPYIRP